MQLALNLKWQITVWDRALEIASGFTRREVLGRNFVEELVASDDQDVVLEALGDTCHGNKEVVDVAFVLYSKAGLPIKLLLDVFPYFDADKSLVGVSIAAKHMQQDEDGIASDKIHFALNSKWQITAWSDAVQKMSSFERNDILGRNFRDFVTLEDQDDLEEVFDHAFQREEDVRDYGFTLYSKNGMPNKLLLNMTPYFHDKSAAGISISAHHAAQVWKESPGHFDHTVEAAIQLLQEGASSNKKTNMSFSATSTAATSMDELPVASLESLPSLSGSPTLEELPLVLEES